jgi:hypothetical protein
LNAISPQASWRKARWFSGFFDQRIRRARLRLSQEWQDLDDPTPSTPSRDCSFELEFVATAANVGAIAAAGRELVDPRVGVAAI